MTKLNHELKTTKQDRDLWKTRYINRSLRGITARSLGEITTIERAVTERETQNYHYEPLSPAYSDMSSTAYSPNSL